MDIDYLLLKDRKETYETQICILTDLIENTYSILNRETNPEKIKDAGTTLVNARLDIVKKKKQLIAITKEIECYRIG